uniref:Uncharacterized protein n=1 Tax=Globodera rostochiensis TaxID=31243 RepID=A0A914HWY0_GLORO
MDCFAEAEHGCVVKGEGTIHTTSAAREDSDELGMALATGCELIRDIKKDAQFEKAGLSIGQLGQVVADACAEQNAKGFEQHELRLIQTLATNGPLILAQIKLEEAEIIQIPNGQNAKKKAKKLAEFDAYLNNELAHGPLKDGLNELLRAKEHLLPSDLLAFLLNKINTFGHNQEGIGGGKMAETSPEKVIAARPPPPTTATTTTVHQRRTRRAVKLIAAFAFVITGLLARNMGMIVLGYWPANVVVAHIRYILKKKFLHKSFKFTSFQMASLTFKMVSLVLLVLCIGVAIEQSQTYMLGYGSVYGYGYPYGGWYGKRQAGFGPSAGGAGGNGGTFGHAGGVNAY